VSTFLTGPAASGKTTELLLRAREAARNGPVLVTSGSEWPLGMLRAQLHETGAAVASLAEVAAALIPHAELIDDVRAVRLFEEAAEPLLQLSWTEFIDAQIDPEVPGLRTPERFLEAAFRLFCKLRDALIDPAAFLESAKRGAKEFYTGRRNLADAGLLYYTKDSHRDSLDVDDAELSRQYRHEVDLAKILAKLYQEYVDHLVKRGCVTGRDAVAEAAAMLRAEPHHSAAVRERYAAAFVDDAQELTIGQVTLMQAIYGESLDGVTLAGDRHRSLGGFRGARPDRVFAIRGEHVIFDPPRDERLPLTLFRGTTQRAEAQFLADRIAALLAEGTPPDRIALLFRSLSSVRIYCDALLERNVPVQIAGDLNVLREPEALDALAVLWALHDPFKHEYLLRLLSGPLLALADASLVTLCSEPPGPQAALFPDAAAQASAARSGRWDAEREKRLAINVLNGDRDADLPGETVRRLQRFRELRAGWSAAAGTLTVPELARRMWSEGLARTGAPGSAAAQYQQTILRHLYDRICKFVERRPGSGLGEFLQDAQERMETPLDSCETAYAEDAVRILSVDASCGRHFDHVFVANVRPGAFPRWYAPDSFLYSASLGMIAKENVGEARAARTAKFSYYMFKSKARESYNREERVAFEYALTRARRSLTVTAFGPVTRGITAPEFLQELRAKTAPNVEDLTDRWRAYSASRYSR
jgi:superfamily I DNA/RNA helicase